MNKKEIVISTIANAIGYEFYSRDGREIKKSDESVDMIIINEREAEISKEVACRVYNDLRESGFLE